MTLPTSVPDADAAALARRIETAGPQLAITAPADADEAWERVVDEGNRAARALARMGFYLLWLKSRMPEGAFAPALTARDIAPRQAADAMRVAELALTVAERTPGDARKLLDLQPAKVKALARLDADELAEAHEQGELDLDDVASMSVRMLRDEVRRLRAKREDLRAQVEHWRTETHRLQRDAGARAPGPERPASVVRARAEGAAFAEQCLATLGALERQVDELLAAGDLGTARPERERNLQAAARPLVLHAGAVAAQAVTTFEAMREALAPWLPAGDWGESAQPDPLSVAEAAALARWRAVHVERMHAAAEEREAERIRSGAIRRGPGRPRKTRAAETA